MHKTFFFLREKEITFLHFHIKIKIRDFQKVVIYVINFQNVVKKGDKDSPFFGHFCHYPSNQIWLQFMRYRKHNNIAFYKHIIDPILCLK